MFLSRIFTLYPEYFPGYLNKGLFGKAMNKKMWKLKKNAEMKYESNMEEEEQQQSTSDIGKVWSKWSSDKFTMKQVKDHLKKDGKDRSLSQKKPGFNYLLMPKDSEESQIVEELSPQGEEISIIKTTDSALTGTNLRLILHNMAIKSVIVTGIFTDQCVSSTVRSLADESFEVLVVEDCCAAATDEIHLQELKIINMIYCHVLQSEDVKKLLSF